MAAVDALNPFKRHPPFAWGKRTLVASVAGLGDLMIHLPLLSGLLHQSAELGIDLEVALRPAHAEIGHRLGWLVVPLENPLQAMFNGKASFPSLQSSWGKTVRQLRAKSYDLCLDLSGSAFNALMFKRGGVIHLASRQTRGGRSLIDHILDHRPFENEYTYQTRLSEILQVKQDFTVYDRLAPQANLRQDKIILAITTSCRWRNWPLRNFLRVVQAFPDQPFILAGHPDEVSTEDQDALQKLMACVNVKSALGHWSSLDLVDHIAQARAIVTNDSATAHIANALQTPGIVLFGPEDSETWAKPGGLQVLHDKSCPHYPCVQWHCQNQSQWCMEKISPASVIALLKPFTSNASASPPLSHD
jgi:ADP-heptose:LPS heptosyltransferase